MTRSLRILTGFGSWLVSVAVTLLGLAALTFFVGRVVPIDPVLRIVGEKATQDVYQRVYLELGLDQPLRVRGLADGHCGYLPWHRERIFRAHSEPRGVAAPPMARDGEPL